MDSKFFKSILFYSKFLAIVILFIFVTAQFNKISAAGSAVIYVSPSSGNYNVGQTFTADIIVDGGGTIFNAAKADVSVSTNLAVKDITLGDCNFAFVRTPTTSVPSFTGVILGGHANNCTVYTLTLQVVGIGQGYVTLANGSVKSYPKALEILSSFKNSTYTLSSSSGNQQFLANEVNPQPTEVPQNNLSSYNIVLNIKSENGSSLPGALVDIEYQGLGKNQPPVQLSPQTSNATGTVEFTNIPKGIYKVTAQYQGKVLAEDVLNVEGTTKSIMLGIQAKKTFDPRLLLLVFIALIIVVMVIVFIYKRRSKNPTKTTTITNV